MKLYIEPTGRRIAPFGDAPGDAPILNKPLHIWQSEAITAGGFTQVDRLEPPCLVIPDSLFCTGEALRSFADQAAGRDAVFVLKTSHFGESVCHVQPHITKIDTGWRFEKVRWHSGQNADPIDIVLDPDEETIEFPAPPYALAGDDTMTISITRHPIMELHHWVHILWANQMAGGIEMRSTPKWKFMLRGLWAVFRARSFNKWKVLGKFNRIGKGCDIHPTAVIEGSTLGDGVTVGPFARVLFSHLADGVTVMPGAQVDLCTVGEKAVVSEKVVIRFCVLYPEAVASQYLMQQCILGEKALTTGGSFSIDVNFDANIRVPLDGKLWSSGQNFLGSAFGHRCRIGTGFWMASGRMVPNDYFLVRNPDRVLGKLPEGLSTAGPIAVIGKKLVGLEGPK